MIKFGTSGFRGIYGDNLTKENIQKISFALFNLVKKEKKSDEKIYIGYDNRFMGKIIASWVAQVLASNNLKVVMYEKSVPSTLIAYKTKNSFIGIHITASHNPYYYNGLKIFTEAGKETDTNFNSKIEKLANKIKINNNKLISYEELINSKKIQKTNKIEDYCNQIITFINAENIKKINPKIIINTMHGSSAECIKLILNKLKLNNYKIINDNIDYSFSNGLPAPYERNLTEQIKILKAENFDYGFALDGDGDRVSFIDKDGKFYDNNYISAMIFYYYLTQKNKVISLVKNCALTELNSLIAKKYKTEVFDANVGFKNIALKMQEHKNALLGVESNGIALKTHIYHKDGLLFGFLVLSILCETGLSIKEFLTKIKTELQFPCEVVEYAYSVTEKQKHEITKLLFEDKKLPETPREIVSVSYADGLKIYFPGGYWGVIRFSGNENVIRLFTEQKNKAECEKYIKCFEKFINLQEKQV